MNPLAILALISNLYEQIEAQQRQISELQKQLGQREKPVP